jgi:hypothetical protein
MCSELEHYRSTIFFLTLRQLIEYRKLQGQFPILNFYCNWTAHGQITKSLAGLQMLAKMSEFSILTFRGINNKFPDFVKKVQEILSLQNMKVEILLLLMQFKINVPFQIANPVSYRFICNILLAYLQNKPIKFSGPPFKPNQAKEERIYNQIMENARLIGWEDHGFIEMYMARSWLNHRMLAIYLIPANPVTPFEYIIPRIGIE